MGNKNTFSIESRVKINFSNSELCNTAYQSILPDFNTKSSHRSQISLEKKDSSLIFHIESIDITAFRASISDIINFVRIMNDITEIT